MTIKRNTRSRKAAPQTPPPQTLQDIGRAYDDLLAAGIIVPVATLSAAINRVIGKHGQAVIPAGES